MMSIADLDTAVRCGFNVVTIILNNESYGAPKANQKLNYGTNFGNDYETPDLAKISEDFGACGWTVEKPSEIDLIKEALNCGKPAVIDVKIDPSIIPPINIDAALRLRKMDYMVKIFARYGSIVIFLFALTPFPDDLLFIPLGVMHYPFWKAFIPALFGKILMTFILAYGGQQSIKIIETLFGGESGLLGMAITAILLILIIVVMIKIDWEKLFEKYVSKEKVD